MPRLILVLEAGDQTSACYRLVFDENPYQRVPVVGELVEPCPGGDVIKVQEVQHNFNGDVLLWLEDKYSSLYAQFGFEQTGNPSL